MKGTRLFWQSILVVAFAPLHLAVGLVPIEGAFK